MQKKRLERERLEVGRSMIQVKGEGDLDQGRRKWTESRDV